MASIHHSSLRIRTYWILWLSSIVVAFVLRSTVFLGVASEPQFGLPFMYMFATWLPIMILNYIEGRRLMQYLKINHRQKWEELTNVPGFGYWNYRNRPIRRWLYSADDLGDPVVAVLKAELRAFSRFVLTVFLSYLIIVPLLFSPL